MPDVHRCFRRLLCWRHWGVAVAVTAALSCSAQAAPLKLLALGDSLTAGYGLPHDRGFVPQLQRALDARHDDVTVLDGGVSGDTSADALARLDWVLGDRPDAAIVELGGNDGLRGLDPQLMQDHIRAILDRLRQAHIPVLLSGMLAPPNMGPEYGARFRAAFDGLARTPGIMWDPFFLDGVAGHPNLQQGDRMHANAAGVQAIVARLVPQIERLLDQARAARSR